MHQYGKILCAMNLAVCTRFGKHIWGLIKSNLHSIKKKQSTEGQHMLEMYAISDPKKQRPIEQDSLQEGI